LELEVCDKDGSRQKQIDEVKGKTKIHSDKVPQIGRREFYLLPTSLQYSTPDSILRLNL
jgi:hypothetical protein